MSRLMIKDVMEQTGVQSTSTVYNWIKNGFLKAIRVGVGRNQHLEVEAEDFDTFLKSDYYPGNPDAIAKQTEMFSRVPLLENCYPYNLLKDILGLDEDRIENEDTTPDPDIWRIDIPAFREQITRLTDREQRVLELRYQFGLTLDESAAVLGITRERIRQIQMKALRKLRYYSVRNEFTTIPVGKYKELEEKIRHLEVENTTLKQQLDKTGIHEEERPDEAPSIREVPIWDLELSVRSSNCLMRAGIETVSDILRFDANQNQQLWVNRDFPFNSWMEIRNLGVRSLQEIAKAVYRYCGYRIRTYNTTDGTWTVVPIPGRDETSKAPENSRLDWSRIQAVTIQGCLVKYGVPWYDWTMVEDGAFKNDDGKCIPISWTPDSLDRNSPIGHATLEYRENDGIYYTATVNVFDKERAMLTQLILDKNEWHVGMIARKVEMRNNKVYDGRICAATISYRSDNASFIDHVSIEYKTEEEQK